MKILNAIKNYIFSTCSFFAFFEFLIFIIGTQITTFNDAITLGTAGIILLFSAMVAAINYIFKIPNLKPLIKLVIHFAALGLCFFILFSAVGSISIEDGIGDVFVMFAVYTILYAIIAGAVFGIGHAIGLIGAKAAESNSKTSISSDKSVKNYKKGKSEEYTNLFTKK